MKKTTIFLPLFILCLFFSNFISAQSTTPVAQIRVENNTGCPVIVRAGGYDSTCNLVCNAGTFTIAANSQLSFPFPCAAIDAFTTTQISVFDPGSGQGGTVGNGCGSTASATYTDCQGINRTITLVAPNRLTIN